MNGWTRSGLSWRGLGNDGHRQDGSYRGAALAGSDLDLPAQLVRALPHSGNTDSHVAAAFDHLQRVRRHSPAGIADRHPDFLGVADDANFGLRTARMAMHIGQRLLQNAE